jgi:hypothetical protein
MDFAVNLNPAVGIPNIALGSASPDLICVARNFSLAVWKSDTTHVEIDPIAMEPVPVEQSGT